MNSPQIKLGFLSTMFLTGVGIFFIISKLGGALLMILTIILWIIFKE